MHAPFAQQLWNFLAAQTWVADHSGCSVLELYMAFTLKTGWLVPLNVTSIPSSERPAFLQSTLKARIWAHETEWAHLQLLRQPLTQQIITFGKILLAIFVFRAYLGRSHSANHRALGFSVPQARRPTSTLDGSAIRYIRGKPELLCVLFLPGRFQSRLRLCMLLSHDLT